LDTRPTHPFPDHMHALMTSEHFTLQSARSIINAEVMSRVNIYYTTLSAILVASAFLAQAPGMGYLFILFAWIAFPVTILLGVFTFARVIVLGRMDYTYIRAINRIRHFYVQATPEMAQYLLFPPYDDDRSVGSYGGYAFTNRWRGNLLSVGHAVRITNSVLATVLLCALLSQAAGITALDFVPFGIVIFALVYYLHIRLGLALANSSARPEYGEAHFPAPPAGLPVDK
jgi:hypothetical protein